MSCEYYEEEKLKRSARITQQSLLSITQQAIDCGATQFENMSKYSNRDNFKVFLVVVFWLRQSSSKGSLNITIIGLRSSDMSQ